MSVVVFLAAGTARYARCATRSAAPLHLPRRCAAVLLALSTVIRTSTPRFFAPSSFIRAASSSVSACTDTVRQVSLDNAAAPSVIASTGARLTASGSAQLNKPKGTGHTHIRSDPSLKSYLVNLSFHVILHSVNDFQRPQPDLAAHLTAIRSTRRYRWPLPLRRRAERRHHVSPTRPRWLPRSPQNRSLLACSWRCSETSEHDMAAPARQ